MHSETNPALIVAIAMMAGMIAQVFARHMRIPGIVTLLAVGVLLGPDFVGVIRPDELGGGLHLLVQFAIAIILFEGGLNLEWRRLRREAGIIRRLVTIGALITWSGGTLSVHYIAGWSWSLSVLFGSLVIVTGPTVITPLLRRIRATHKIDTILEAEGIFIDAVGALIAVITLEVVLRFSGEMLAIGFMSLPTRLLIGAGVGLAAGLFLALLLRVRGIVPDGLQNVFTLSCALATFQISNKISPESGIVAVIVQGMVLGNMRIHVEQELKEFKEQLTVLLIGMLFVLLAADVRIDGVRHLGLPGLMVVISLMFIVRPICVFACTVKGGLNWREKLFLSWVGPRGIVAAAVASLFYERMTHIGMPGGEDMLALVFLVISVTVVFQGGTGGLVARALGVVRPSGRGYVILGAEDLPRVLARLLRDGGEEVVMIDANPAHCREAEREGFRVLHGNALEERILVSAHLDTRRAAVAMLRNAGVNLLFARKSLGEYGVPRLYVAMPRGSAGVTEAMVAEAGGLVLSSGEFDMELWDVRVRRNTAALWRMEWNGEPDTGSSQGRRPGYITQEQSNVVFPLALESGNRISPLHVGAGVREGDHIHWLVFVEKEDQAVEYFSSRGWSRAELTADPEALSP